MQTASLPLPGSDVEEARRKDYSLVGRDTALAVERGLAEADWYASPVPRDVMRELLERRDGPALRDTLLYFALIFTAAYLTWRLWGSWWALLPMMAYGVLYASASDARWHEAGHGTAFRTDWMNDALYEVASFMVLRESIPWRWSHARHHSDTIIVGRDPEIAVPRPPDAWAMLWKCFNYRAFRRYVTNITLHTFGRVTAEEATFIPPSEYGKVFLRARVYAAIFVTMFGLCAYYHTWLPFVFVLGPNLYGAWLMAVYGWTQHAGLAENVLDHRLNCRTIHMNRVHRFLYWNMNYHLEHHMFPMVPYHQLPRLHELVKDDCPDPYPSLTAAYREIVPAIVRQIREPGWFVRRRLPPTARPVGTRPSAPALTAADRVPIDGWIDVCDSRVLAIDDVLRFDHAHHTYAIYRTAHGSVHATDGICTHGNTHLADGMVSGTIVECPKHNGRFDVVSGEPRRLPVCIALRTHPVKEVDGRILLDVGERGASRVVEQTYELQVVSNRNVATFIKELVLGPVEADNAERRTPNADGIGAADRGPGTGHRAPGYAERRTPNPDEIGTADRAPGTGLREPGHAERRTPNADEIDAADRGPGTGHREPGHGAASHPNRGNGDETVGARSRRALSGRLGEPLPSDCSTIAAASTADGRLGVSMADGRSTVADDVVPMDDGRMPKAGRDASFPCYKPGQYLQLHIPAYGAVRFSEFDVAEPYAPVWRAHHLFDLRASNDIEMRRNYSMASNPASPVKELRFNVRIATPPTGQDCDAGAGSSWVWRLKTGDRVTASGPYGDFVLRDSAREIVYVGGGAGMAPIRSHLSHLFETVQTGRTVSYWYGARSRQEIFYEDYFRELESRFANFRFHVALSAPLPEDAWAGHSGFIHDVLRREHLEPHAAPSAAEYYLCGPPVMVHATRDMLRHEFGVAAEDIIADEF